MKRGRRGIALLLCAAMLSCLQACAGSAGAAGVDSAEKPVQVHWPKDKLKTGKNGAPLLQVYVVEDQQVKERELESYVEGVLAGEMKNDWPLEALKAQAILARTFVLKFVQEKESQYPGADISTDIEEAQAYDASAVNERIQQAVEETRGLVLSCEGELPYAWFHAHSGGMTEYARTGLGWEKDEPAYTQPSRGTEPEQLSDAKENQQLQAAAEWKLILRLQNGQRLAINRAFR
ncbi:MAG: SpoIID/LytB domain-containing protein [Lachnospiraceae bacterium]